MSAQNICHNISASFFSQDTLVNTKTNDFHYRNEYPSEPFLILPENISAKKQVIISSDKI